MAQDMMILRYMEGYRDGLRDGRDGKESGTENGELMALPLRLLPLSTRAKNCLSSTGCASVADVVAMTGVQIMRVRNLGVVTAREIAVWLAENGIFDSAWGQYL